MLGLIIIFILFCCFIFLLTYKGHINLTNGERKVQSLLKYEECINNCSTKKEVIVEHKKAMEEENQLSFSEIHRMTLKRLIETDNLSNHS